MIQYLFAVVVAFILFKVWQIVQGNGKMTSSSISSSISHAFNASSSFQKISDKFKTFDELQAGLRSAGLESSNLIFGVDFTRSNQWTGKRTFGGRCMHELNGSYLNPYQSVISILGRTLEPFDDDKLIPAYGFGDSVTADRAVFNFNRNGAPCNGFAEVLSRYTDIAPKVELAGPTSFAPIIREAIKIVKKTKSYHILVIVADGQVTNEKETVDAIVEASQYPLSILLVGVGDGPWEMMERFDDELPERTFDNFQFVDFHTTMVRHDGNELIFATKALMEIPDQFRAIRDLGLFKNC